MQGNDPCLGPHLGQRVYKTLSHTNAHSQLVPPAAFESAFLAYESRVLPHERKRDKILNSNQILTLRFTSIISYSRLTYLF